MLGRSSAPAFCSLSLAMLAACTHPLPLQVPPPTTAVPPPGAFEEDEESPRAARHGMSHQGRLRTSGAATRPRAGAYAGLGAESVSRETLTRFAPTPLPAEVSRRIQAMLDIRAPLGARIAPGANSLYFAWNVSGTMQVWKTDGPRKFPVQLTGGEDVTRVAGMLPDGKGLVVSRDRKGEENPGLYLLPAEGGALREIQHLAKVQTQLQYVSDDGAWVYFRANDEKPDSYRIHRWNVKSGKRELVFAEPGLWSVADHVGSKLLLTRQTGELTSEVWEYEEGAAKATPLFGQNEKEEYELAYSGNAGEILVQTPKFGDFRRLYRVKTSARKGAPLEAADVTAITPDAKHDVASFSVDHARKHVYYTTNEGGFTRAHAMDARTFKDEALPRIDDATHVTFGAPTWDGRYVVMNVGTSRAPTTSYVYDWQSQKLTPWVTASAPEIDTSHFAVATAETYPARDGTKIPMFVRRPAACEKAKTPCPVLVAFHGGPEGQALPGFGIYGQIFVDAGFVFVEPNVRGSDGYGKAWLHADDGPKRLAVITDIEDAARFVKSAWAKDGVAPKVGIMGGSYGGYSTLMGMTRFAGAYDAGVANVGMSNLVTFLRNTAPYRRALRASEYGDPVRDHAALVELSPITHIDKVKGAAAAHPGGERSRVPVGEAIQMHAGLERRGVPTMLIVFPDEGHGTQKRENKVLEIGHTLAFFEAQLLPKK